MKKSKFRCSWINQQDIRKIADGVRSTYWPQKGLPVNVEHIIEFGLRLDIQPIPQLFSNFEIDTWLKLDFTGIIVDEGEYLNEKFENRLRFSFAHELGHFFLHSDVLRKLTINSLKEWQKLILNIPGKDYGWFEFQANEFGGRLVVPLQDLKVHLTEACKKLKEEKTLVKYLAQDPDLVLSCITPSLCRPFGVSEDVIFTRVKREGLWPPEELLP